jgi:hypothetical protein
VQSVQSSGAVVYNLINLYFYMITHYMLPGDYAAVYALGKEDLENRIEDKKAVFTLAGRWHALHP